jgi:hypothetical protein
MTIQIYNCETLTIQSELVQRTKSEGVFYGLRLHMNTDQAITFWSKTEEGLLIMTQALIVTLSQPARERQALPGQMSQ